MLFRPGPAHIPAPAGYTEGMIRFFLNAVLIYIGLIILMRIIGKRQLGELELSELVVTILISEVASQPLLEPETSLLRVAVPVITLLALEYFLSVLALGSVRFRVLLTGKPALLVVHGRIDQRQMRKNRITPDELAEALRNDGLLDLNDVEYAILETSGKLNIIPVPEKRAATAGQLGVKTRDAGYPIMVINNGRVLTENLGILGRDEAWLREYLASRKLSSPRQVYMMTVDMAGGVFLAPREG